ncbi:MAG TPA: pilus assembly protein PilP [Pseudomonadales bacterium]|nr:pilus assembly protein PilP [Pseudomonadales bacterium]
MRASGTILYRTFIVAMLGILAACSSGNRFADIDKFKAEVAKEPISPIQPLPEFEPYQPFTYGASNLRSPFQPPVVIPPKTDEQKRNIGVKPPEDHVKQYLERFNLASLLMVGTIEKDNSTWALIQDPTGGVHRVQVGDYMGTNWGKVESVNDTRIDITEIVSDGQGGWLRRPRTIELKGLSK